MHPLGPTEHAVEGKHPRGLLAAGLVGNTVLTLGWTLDREPSRGNDRLPQGTGQDPKGSPGGSDRALRHLPPSKGGPKKPQLPLRHEKYRRSPPVLGSGSYLSGGDKGLLLPRWLR